MKYSLSGLNRYLTRPLTIDQIVALALSLGHSPEEVGQDWLELEITANRGDVLSHLGLARELAAASSQTLNLELPTTTADQRLIIDDTKPLSVLLKTNDLSLELKVEQPDSLEALSLALVSLPRLDSQSLQEFSSKLEGYPDQHAINPLVDLSNYLTLDWGMPSHIFDLQPLLDQQQNPNQSIQLTLSQLEQPATYISLTEQQHSLLPGDLVITDHSGQPIDLVGIQGSHLTKLNQQSRLLLIAVIVPKARLVRQTSRRLNLITEASYRLERGVDRLLVEPTLQRILAELAQACGTLDSLATVTATRQVTPTKIALIPELFSRSLGFRIEKAEIIANLKRLGLTNQNDQVTIPSYRLDLSLPIDLVEEYGRLSGYTQLKPQPLPRLSTVPPERLAQSHRQYCQIENLKDQLIDLGYTELVTESMASADNLRDLGWSLDQLVKLRAPQNQLLAYCRPTIVSNLLQVASQNNWSDNQLLFEIGTVFPDQTTELTVLTLVSTHKKPPVLTLSQQELSAQWQTLSIDQPLAKRLSLRKAVHYLELPVATILGDDSYKKLELATTKLKLVSEWPPSVRDLAVIIDQSISSQQLIEAIKTIEQEQLDSPEIILVDHFDTFKSPSFNENQISYAFHLVYQRRLNQLQPLTNDEVDEAFTNLCQILKRQFSLTIR